MRRIFDTTIWAGRFFDLSLSDIEGWVDDAKRGFENGLRANPLNIREQYGRHLNAIQEAYGGAMLELRAGTKLQTLMERETEQLFKTTT